MWKTGIHHCQPIPRKLFQDHIPCSLYPDMEDHQLMVWFLITKVYKALSFFWKYTVMIHLASVVNIFYKVPLSVFLNSDIFTIIQLFPKVTFPYYGSSFFIFRATWSAVWPVSFILLLRKRDFIGNRIFTPPQKLTTTQEVHRHVFPQN